ncbi:hypothetical protein J2S49_000435 [Arcanobacterium wilhelmae]|uniref:DUF3800 domain-containing protein n=1 Tax=Arcanobacterium wilhelmae TaxID=1803177 RepID=A0ABT9N9H2_9ACTO|nr:DUF3800 domain-containing protein [Arcanobacterium wilhelmae]MDP9800359.1 hypothetical protein [Arcanobacterium wilhelmae]
MSDYFIYLDETGTPDYSHSGGNELPYFGFGSVIYSGEHGSAIWDAHVLRASLEDRGVATPHGFHAKNDTWATRSEVFALIAQHKLSFDATLLYKDNACGYVKEEGKARLYKMALYLHLKYLCTEVFSPGDRLYVVLATISTKSFRESAKVAFVDIVNQMPQQITPCFWDSDSAWGLQAADYLLWATQRRIKGKPIAQDVQWIQPSTNSVRFPWGTRKR